MYFVKYGNQYLHDPRTDDYILIDLKLDCEENSCGYCDFTIYPNHPMYGLIKERDADNPIAVYDGLPSDDTLLFAGFIYELGKEFYLEGTVKCKGELDYLNESIVRPYSTLSRAFGQTAPNTVDGYFEWLIQQHNSQVSENKQFVIGINEGASLDSNNYIYRENDGYPTTIDEISSKLLNNENLGGYLRVRHENGVRYIDYLCEWNDKNSQVLDFGVNMTDYSQVDNAADIASFVIPLGANMSETDYDYERGYSVTSDTSMVSGKQYYTSSITYEKKSELYEFAANINYYEYNSTNKTYSLTVDETPNSEKTYYTKKESYSECTGVDAFEEGVTYYEYDRTKDESDQKLTIKGLPDTTYYSEYRNANDMLYSKTAFSEYGWVGFVYENSNIKTVEYLVRAGLIALREYVAPIRTIEIKAVDMHLINPDIKPIRIGEYVRIRSNPHNFDSYLLCRNISLDLNNPENSIYTLGTSYDTWTGEQNSKINELNAAVNKQIEASQALSEEVKDTANIAAAIHKNVDKLIVYRNLYQGTKYFTGSKWKNLEYWITRDIDESIGFREYGFWGTSCGIYQEVEVKENQIYTFSFYARSDNGANLRVLADWDGTAIYPACVDIGVITDEYTRYSATFRATKNGIICPRVENTVESGFSIYGLKFENSAKATAWSEAPEDTELLIAEQDEAICALYEESLEYQAETDDAICALYEMISGGE